MANSTNSTNSIPVYQHDSREAAKIYHALEEQYQPPAPYGLSEEQRQELLISIPACVIVGRFRQYQISAHTLHEGTPVTAYAAGGSVVYSEFVKSIDRYEPETRNQIGGTGAYRPIPNEAGIAHATNEAIKALS